MFYISAAQYFWLVKQPYLIIFLLTVIASLLLYVKFVSNIPEGTYLPQGPRGYPIIGNLLCLDPKTPHLSLTAIAKEFGPAFSLKLGSVYTIVFCKEKLIRQALGREQIIGRAPLYITHGIMEGKGIICAEGEMWREHRRFLLGWLKATGRMFFGSGRNNLESHIQIAMGNCAQSLIKMSKIDSNVDITSSIHYVLGDIMNQLVFGVSWPEGHSTWKYLVHLQEEGVKHMGVCGAVNFIPILRFLPSNWKTLRFLMKGKQKTHEIYDKIINNHRLKIDVRERQPCDLNTAEFKLIHDPAFEKIVEKLKNKELLDSSDTEYLSADCVLDYYLYEEIRRQDEEFSDECQLRHALADMWGAGVDTTAATLRWLFLFLAVHPECQEKARRDLPKDGPISIKDRNKATYLQACILETQRIRSVVPLGIPHGTLEDTLVADYFIPKGTMVIPFQWALHMDPEIWPEPDDFKPERFLDEKNQIKSPGNFLPFQAGKRVCLGEELARTLLFMGAATILQQVNISIPKEYSKSDIERILDGLCGLTMVPGDHKLHITKVE